MQIIFKSKDTEKSNSFKKSVELGRKDGHLSGPDTIRQLCSILKGCLEAKFSSGNNVFGMKSSKM